MTSATCPACGVPVVPGYVKCPKCHAVLPRVTFKRGGTNAATGVSPSGTSLERSGAVPWPAIVAGAVVVLGVVAFFVFRHGGSAKAEPPSSEAPAQQVSTPVASPQQVAAQPSASTEATQPQAQAGPSPQDIARDLKQSLDRQRLWSDVSVNGNVLEVRSSECGDPAMGPALDAAAPQARAAGLGTLRCVSQTGGVVSSRAL